MKRSNRVQRPQRCESVKAQGSAHVHDACAFCDMQPSESHCVVGHCAIWNRDEKNGIAANRPGELLGAITCREKLHPATRLSKSCHQGAAEVASTGDDQRGDLITTPSSWRPPPVPREQESRPAACRRASRLL